MKKLTLKLLIICVMLSLTKPSSAQNILVNGDFNTPYSYIVPVYSTPPPMNSWGYWSAVSAWAGIYNGECIYQIYWPSTNTWDVQLAYWGFQLTAGHSYRLKFDVKTDANRNFGVFIGQDGGNWTNFNLNYTQSATTSWQTKIIEFKVPMVFSLHKLSFELGGTNGISYMYFDNIVLEDIGPYSPLCLSDGSFNSPLTIEPIDQEINDLPLNKWLQFLYDNADGTATVADGICKFHIINPGDYPSFIQLAQYGFDLIQGHDYRLSFDVKSDAPRTFGVWLGEYFGGWTNLLGWDRYTQNATTEWQTKTFDFNATGSFPVNKLSFEIGASNIDMYFDNIILKDLAYPDQVVSISSTPDIADNFCNGVLLTANSNVPVQSYAWSNGVTTETNFLTTANPSGVYTVNVSAAVGCPNISSASFDYDKQALTSSYTLLATNSIRLQQYNTVLNGSVGVVNSTGSASIKKNTSINGTGAFLKAQSISLQSPYTIPTIVYAPASVALPTMQYNTTSTSGLPNATVPNGTTITISGDRKNVTIGNNCNVTLTGNIFGVITIGSGSSVLLTQSSIDVTAITMNAGTVSANTQLKFSGDAILRCAGSIVVNTRSIINSDNHKVVIYLGKTNGAPVVFSVSAGGNETVIASMYIPSGKISIGGDASNMTYMNGKFIAENIETLDKNVIWNWYDCSSAAPEAVSASKTNITVKEQPVNPTIGLNIKAWPNPSNNQFTLNVESNSNEKIELIVFDMYGRIVYTTKGSANRQYQFGNRFVSGAYVAVVRQGVNRSTVELVKQ